MFLGEEDLIESSQVFLEFPDSNDCCAMPSTRLDPSVAGYQVRQERRFSTYGFVPILV